MTSVAFGVNSARNFFTFFGTWSAQEKADVVKANLDNPVENAPITIGARNVYENSFLHYHEQKYGSEKNVTVYDQKGNIIRPMEGKRHRKTVLNPITTDSMTFLSEWMCQHFDVFDFHTLLNEEFPDAGVWLRKHMYEFGHPLPRKKDTTDEFIELPKTARTSASGAARAGPRHAAESPAHAVIHVRPNEGAGSSGGGRVKAVASASTSGAGSGKAVASASSSGAGSGKKGPGPHAQRGYVKRVPIVAVDTSSDDSDAGGAGRNQPLKKRADKTTTRRNPPCGSGPAVRDDGNDDYVKQLAMDADVLILKQSVEVYVETRKSDGKVVINTFFAIDSKDEDKNDKAQNDPNVVHYREFVLWEGKPTYVDVFDRKNGGMQMAGYDVKEYKLATNPMNADYEGMQISTVSLIKRAELVEPAYQMFDELIREMNPRECYKNNYQTFRILLGKFMDEQTIHEFVTKRAEEQRAQEEINAILSFLNTPGQVIKEENIDEFEMIAKLMESNLVKGTLDSRAYDQHKQTLYTLCCTSPHAWSLFLPDETVINLLDRINERLRLLGCSKINVDSFKTNRMKYIREAEKLLDFKQAKQLEEFNGHSFKVHYQAWPGLWADIQDQVSLYESCKRHLATVEEELKLTQEQSRKQEEDIAKMIEQNETLKKELVAARAMGGGAPPASAGAPASPMADPSDDEDEDEDEDEDKDKDEDKDEDEDKDKDEDNARPAGTKVLASKAGLPPPTPVDKKARLVPASLEEVQDSQPTQALGRTMSPRAEKVLNTMPPPSAPRFTRNGSPIPGTGPKSLPASGMNSPEPEVRRKSARPRTPRATLDPTAYGPRGGGLISDPK